MSRAPTRIDLGGGWTDVPPYCEREGGFVCNVAIGRYAAVTVRSRDGSRATHDGSESALVLAVLRRTRVTDVWVELENDFPVGAGLGGSSAASAALLTALAAWNGETPLPDEIAELGRTIEVEDLGVAGGRQDHYAAVYGGALALTFTRDTSVRRIPMDDATIGSLVDRCLLVYTGESRISGDTITAVLDAYERGDPRVTQALRRMKEIAREMALTLERGSLDALGGLLREHWTHQRSLHPAIPTARIDAIIARAQAAGALGAKAMGASGGGCVLVLARDGGREAVRRAINGLGEILDFTVDASGARVVRAEGL